MVGPSGNQPGPKNPGNFVTPTADKILSVRLREKIAETIEFYCFRDRKLSEHKTNPRNSFKPDNLMYHIIKIVLLSTIVVPKKITKPRKSFS